MIRDEPPPSDRSSSPAPPIEEGTPPSQRRFAQDDAPIEPVSDLDIEESLRLLDEIWPRDSCHEEQFPRQFGRFTILGELGRGGFGVVYLAEDPLLGRKVALKLPRVEVLSGTEGWRRFLREARAASRLDHPNLIPLLDAGTIGPVGYIVTAFVPGPSLEQWLRYKRSKCSPRWGARLVRALALAIEHAHQKDVLHRDLKPANVLLHAPECNEDMPGHRTWESGQVESWKPRICDFGLAKLREIEADETKSRIACGSPPYMAPEQAEARAHDIGPATDVYGLGTILYELLTGRPPFSGKSDLETLRKVVADEPVSPRKVRPGVPRDLETICLKCLSKRPENRYHTAAALAQDLERYLEGRPIEARPVPVWARGWKWARRKPALAALATAVILAFVAGTGGLLWHESVLREVKRATQRLQRAAPHRGQASRRQCTGCPEPAKSSRGKRAHGSSPTGRPPGLQCPAGHGFRPRTSRWRIGCSMRRDPSSNLRNRRAELRMVISPAISSRDRLEILTWTHQAHVAALAVSPTAERLPRLTRALRSGCGTWRIGHSSRLGNSQTKDDSTPCIQPRRSTLSPPPTCRQPELTSGMCQPAGSLDGWSTRRCTRAVLIAPLQSGRQSLCRCPRSQQPHRTRFDRLLGHHTTGRPVHAGERRELHQDRAGVGGRMAATIG